MKRQLQGIALILVSILLMLGYGNVAFFDLSFKWALIFSVIGITGVIMTFTDGAGRMRYRIWTAGA